MESSSSDLTSPICSKTCRKIVRFHFAVEMNFAGLPSGADDRYFSDLQGNRLGQLGKRLDLHDTSGIRLTDEWLGIETGCGSIALAICGRCPSRRSAKAKPVLN